MVSSQHSRKSYPDFQYSFNPLLKTVTVFSILVLFFIIYNYQTIDFEYSNLFTLIWTWLLLLLIHTIINFKKFKLLIINREKEIWLRSYIQYSYLFLPYLVIALLYDNWILIQQVSSDYIPVIDGSLKIIDEFMFGFQPAFLMEQWIHPLAVDYFMIAYSMFFIYPFFYLIYLIQKNELVLFQKVLFAQNIAIILSLVCFIIFPAKGPRVFLAEQYTIPLHGINFDVLMNLYGKPSFFDMQRDLWNFLERVKTDCMPSMHAGLCLLCLFYALKNRSIFKHRRRAVIFWITGVGSLLVSTIYLRYHWVIDVIAGAVAAVAIYYMVELIFKNWISKSKYKKFLHLQAPWIQASED